MDGDSLGLQCPACGSQDSICLGTLGARWWFRCRDCGIDFNLPAREPTVRQCPNCGEWVPDTEETVCPVCNVDCTPV